MSRWMMYPVVVAALLVPRASNACGGTTGGGGSHAHSATSSPTATSTAPRSVAKLLADPNGRQTLRNTLLADETFMQELVDEIGRRPEWRTYALSQLGASPGLATTQPDAVSRPPVTEPAERQQARYVCPMHSEVRANAPGTCPKCGMALEPVAN